MSESMSYQGRSEEQQWNDSTVRQAKELQLKRRQVESLRARIAELEPLLETALTPAEANVVLKKLAGGGEMSLDYLHAREKLKATNGAKRGPEV